MAQQIIFTNAPGAQLDAIVASLIDQKPVSKVFVITDSNTRTLVLPIMAQTSGIVSAAKVIEVPAGDTNKNIDSLSHIWQEMVEGGGTRTSLVVNLGGGMVTDMGGFAAATFKRGIRFVNIPTTLLSAVDAAVGGKTGINFLGYKNEIGAFCEADAVIISTIFFETLPVEERLSGYGEMLKHALLKSGDALARLMRHDIIDGSADDLLTLLEENVNVKRDVVLQDPKEQGIRKALNLGHTPGHAFESRAMAMGSPVPHGYAVAWGLVVDLVLSHMLNKFPSATLHTVAAHVKSLYGSNNITCRDYDTLVQLMRHDKKNLTPEGINFTLLDAPGAVHIDCIVDQETIRQALDIFNDLIN